MIRLNTINNREIFYLTKDENWKQNFPKKLWTLFIIADENNNLINEIAKESIKQNVEFVCCSGMIAGLIEQIFDEVIVNKILFENLNPENQPITTMHENFDEGFWFSCINSSSNSEQDIEKIVILDLTQKGVKNYLKILTEKMCENWLPDNDVIKLPIYDK